MSIILLRAPESAREALEADLGAFMEEPSRVAGEAIALPIFVVDQKKAFDVEDLGTYDQPDAWRFVLVGEGRNMAIADVTRQKAEYELFSMSEDTERAEELLRLLTVAANSTDASDDFELRLFEAPAFHIRAVWLHGRSRRHCDFFLLADGRGRWPDEIMTADQFAGVFNKIQDVKLGPRGYVDYGAVDRA